VGRTLAAAIAIWRSGRIHGLPAVRIARAARRAARLASRAVCRSPASRIISSWRARAIICME
jgi:hypothetical protein